MKIRTRINLVLSGAALLAMAVMGTVSYLGLRSEALAFARREAEMHLQAIDAARAYAAEEALPGAWDVGGDARLLAQVNRHYDGHDYSELLLPTTQTLSASLQTVVEQVQRHPQETVLQFDERGAQTRLVFVRALRSAVPGAGARADTLTGLQMVAMPLELPMGRVREAFWRQLAGMAGPVLVLFLVLNLMLRQWVVHPVDVHQRALRRLATQDSLTGVWNRRGFMARLLRILRQVEERPEPVSLVMMDLDHFKRINDQHGHVTGDAVLQEVAHRLQRRIRRSDVLGRLGGEEFAVILPGTDEAGARVQAAYLLEVIRSQPYATVGRVTASLGVAQWNGHEPLSAWLQRADLALYAAKRSGRDRCVVAEDLLDSEALNTLPARPDWVSDTAPVPVSTQAQASSPQNVNAVRT